MKQIRSVFLRAFALGLVVLASLCFSTSLLAQPANVNPQLEKDVREILAIDQKVAELGKEAAATKMSKVDYASRLAPLTQARAEIVKRYGSTRSPEYRDMLARFNAVKKEQAQAVLDAQRAVAKEKAAMAAEAKAKAIADAQAKMAADQAAKKKAADDAIAAQAKAVEDDAQEYTRLALRHDELLNKLNLKRITDAERGDMMTLRLDGEAIKQKYGPGGASRQRAAEYEKRVKELSDQVIAPARKGWIAAGFPEADVIVSGFSDDAERLGALKVFERLLSDTVGQPLGPAASEKFNRYRAAMGKIGSPSGGANLKLDNASDRLARSHQFQYDVLKKLAPAYAGPAEQLVKKDQYEAKVKAEVRRVNLGITAVALLLLALPPLYLFRGERALTAKRDRNPDDAYPFQLPKSLGVVDVLCKKYLVEFECGLIYDKEMWTETTTTTTHHPGQTYVSGGIVTTTAGHSSTSTSTTVYHRYWIRTPDGRETWQRYSDDAFPAAKGQLISSVGFGTDLMLAYNNSTGQFAELKPGIRAASRMKGRWVWLASIAVGLVGFWAVEQVLVSGTVQAQNPHTSGAVTSLIVGTAILSGIYIGILKIIVQLIRQRQFNKKWSPQLRKFMEERTAKLIQRFPADECARAVEGPSVSRPSST